MNLRFPRECEINSSIDWSDIEKIYSHIADDISKEIFNNRLLASLTNDEKYINRIVMMTNAMIRFNKDVDGPTYIYGAGKRTRRLLELFPNKEWKGIIDNYKEGTYLGYQIYKPDEVSRDSKIVVSNYRDYEAIKEFLVGMGYNAGNILLWQEYVDELNRDIYFEKRCLNNRTIGSGLFMDIGCYDGKDSIRAIRESGEGIANVLAFEPNSENYAKCKNVLEHYTGIELVPLGVSDHEGQISFLENDSGSHIATDGGTKIDIVTIDSITADKTVGFIKMDIEGEEEKALIGAEKTIQKYKPILALSIYHRRSDIWRLPQRILDINSDYKFYFGHYTLEWGDTVIYAI